MNDREDLEEKYAKPKYPPRPQSEPTAASSVFADMASAAMAQPVPCSACGALCDGPICGDCHEKQKAAAWACAQQRRIERLEQSIPKSFLWSSFTAPELATRVRTTQACAVAKNSVGAPWVVLCGGAGSGKTALAVAMLREWASLERVGDAAFVSAVRLGMARIQHRAGQGDPELVEIAMRAPMIVLDGLGEERETRTNAVYDVIYERHAYGRTTVITTAFTEEGVEHRYGEGIARRIFDGSRSRVIELEAAKLAWASAS